MTIKKGMEWLFFFYWTHNFEHGSLMIGANPKPKYLLYFHVLGRSSALQEFTKKGAEPVAFLSLPVGDEVSVSRHRLRLNGDLQTRAASCYSYIVESARVNIPLS